MIKAGNKAWWPAKGVEVFVLSVEDDYAIITTAPSFSELTDDNIHEGVDVDDLEAMKVYRVDTAVYKTYWIEAYNERHAEALWASAGTSLFSPPGKIQETAEDDESIHEICEWSNSHLMCIY